MATPARKQVVFRGPAGEPAVGEAVAAFNAVAARLGLPFAAATETGPGVTPVAVVAINLPDATDAEAWTVPPADRAAVIERDVSSLVARLLGGRTVADSPPPPPKPAPPKKVHTVRVGRETAGRRGKGVTTVFDLPLTGDQLRDLAAALKQKCGTGGTVKDGKIEIQGDHRDRVAAELEAMGYRVKRAGG